MKELNMSKRLRYTDQHEELLKEITNGLTLDEVLVGTEDYREQLRVKLYEIYSDCTTTEDENKVANELDEMIIHFEPGQREAIWKDDDRWVPEFESFLKKHSEKLVPLKTESPEELARRIAYHIDQLDAGKITLPEEDPIVDGYADND